MHDSVVFDPIKDANSPAAQHMYVHLAAYTNEELLQAIYEKGKLRGRETSEGVHYVTDEHPYPLGEYKQEANPSHEPHLNPRHHPTRETNLHRIRKHSQITPQNLQTSTSSPTPNPTKGWKRGRHPFAAPKRYPPPQH